MYQRHKIGEPIIYITSVSAHQIARRLFLRASFTDTVKWYVFYRIGGRWIDEEAMMVENDMGKTGGLLEKPVQILRCLRENHIWIGLEPNQGTSFHRPASNRLKILLCVPRRCPSLNVLKLSQFIYHYLRTTLCVPNHIPVTARTCFALYGHHLQGAQSSCILRNTEMFINI